MKVRSNSSRVAVMRSTNGFTRSSLPVSTMSRRPLARAAVTLSETITSAIMLISARALSSGLTSDDSFPKLLAVASAGRLPTGPPATSPTVRSMRDRSPRAASCSSVSSRATFEQMLRQAEQRAAADAGAADVLGWRRP